MKESNIVRYIGIDFGTSTSVVSYMDYEKVNGNLLRPMYTEPLPVKFDESYTTVPTVIQIPGRQYNPIKKEYVELTDMSFGRDALSKLSSHPDLVRQNFKMNLMSENEEKRNEARELLTRFFKMLYETYKEQRRFSGNEEPEEYTYVSYPAKWSEENGKLMIEVAAKAGFPNVKGMDEPVAAMRYCLTTETEQIKELRSRGVFVEDNPLNILLIDMGAGTTDLVLYKFTPKNSKESEVEVLATYPPAEDPATFGGSEIDEIITNYIKEYLEKNLYKQPLPYNKLKDICKTWKEKVISPELQNGKSIDDLPSDLIYVISYLMREDAEDFPGIDKSKLGELLKDYMPVFTDMLSKVIEKANVSAGDIDLVIVTGGHSQWYFVKEILLGRWVPGLNGSEGSPIGISLKKIIDEPWRIIATPYPQQVVSHGLAMAGKEIQYKKKSDVPKVVQPQKSIPVPAHSSAFSIGNEPIFSIKAYENQIKCIAFSNDQNMIAAGGTKNNTINVWNIKNSEWLCSMTQNNEPNKIAFSADSRYIVFQPCVSGGLYIYEVKPGNYDKPIHGVSGTALLQFDVSPIQNELAYETIGEVWVISIPEGKVLFKWKNIVHWLLGTISNVAYSYDGSMVIASPGSKDIRVFKKDMPKQISEWNWRNADNITKVSISNDGRLLGAIAHNGGIRLWTILSGSYQELPAANTNNAKVLSRTFTPSLDYCFIVNEASGNNVNIYDLKTMKKTESIPQFSDVTAISISRNGSCLATGHKDGTLNVWSIL